MKMFKLGFRNRSVPQQLEICQRMVRNIAALPPDQCDAAHRTRATDAVTAVAESDARVQALKSQLRSELSRRKTLLSAARTNISQACNHVAGNLNFDPARMLGAGMELEESKTRPVGLPDAPANLRGEAQDVNDAVRLRWDCPMRRCTFVVEMTADPSGAQGWKQCDVAVRRKSLITGMTSGAKYWFRVCAVNSHGQSAWSNPVCVRVK